jgi:hypothetical protein
MKKYKEILSEQLSNRQNQLGRVQTSSQDLSSFGAGKQTLSSLSATQAQTPLQTAYASATRLGNAITQYKQGNVKAQKNYFGTNVVGKKPPVRDDDERDAIERPDLTFVPSSIETLSTTPFTSKDLDDAIKSGDADRIAKTAVGNYAGSAFRIKDAVKNFLSSLLGTGGAPRPLRSQGPLNPDGTGSEPPRPPEPPEPPVDDTDEAVDEYAEFLERLIGTGVANRTLNLGFNPEDTKQLFEVIYGDVDGDGIPGWIENLFVGEGSIQEFLQSLLDDPTVLQIFGYDEQTVRQFLDLVYSFDPDSPGEFTPEFVEFLRIYFGLDPLPVDDRPPPGTGPGTGGRP